MHEFRLRGCGARLVELTHQTVCWRAKAMSIDLEEQTQRVLETLRDQARARNMDLAQYLQLFADAGQVAAADVELSEQEFEALLDQIADGLPLLAPLPRDFSRADIYAE